jgi:hypothetical protein
MSKQIRDITIFVDFLVDNATGREYVEHASIQIRDEDLNLVANHGLHSVVNNERELWDHVELTVQRMIDEGHKIDNPRVHVWRSHQTRIEVDYYKAIGHNI